MNDPLSDQKRAATLLQREEETTYVEEAIGDRLGDEASDLRGDGHWAASRSGVAKVSKTRFAQAVLVKADKGY